MTFIVAEAGVAHLGSLEKACRLVREAHAAGADAVKFQAYSTYEFEGKTPQQYEILKKCELSAEHLAIVAAYAKHVGIEFFATPFQPQWVDVLDKLGVKRFKVSSQSVGNGPLLDAIRATAKLVIISNGMCDDTQLREALDRLGAGRLSAATILSCVSKYPTEEEDVYINSMAALKPIFPDCNIGWSDHTRGMFACVSAAQAGAVMVEKHIGLGDNSEPDACCSLDPCGFAHMVNQIRTVNRVRMVAT